MKAMDGFLLTSENSSPNANIIEEFRASALRHLTAAYARAVADEVCRLKDLHDVGAIVKPASANPLAEASETVGRDPEPWDGRCRIRLFPVSQGMLAIFDPPNATFASILSSIDGVRPWSATQNPQDLERILATPQALFGISIQIGTGPLPAPTAEMVIRRIPALHARVERAAKVYLDRRLTTRQGSTVPIPGGALARIMEAEAKSDVERLLRDVRDVQEIQTYGTPRISEVRESRSKDISHSIDHGDLVETEHGEVMLAVPEVGLKTTDRVFILVSDDYISIVQNSVEFGHIKNIPKPHLDELRHRESISLVEMEGREGHLPGPRRIHIALINDVSLADRWGTSILRWRKSGVASRKKAEKPAKESET
jgi:hypothetical protein